VETKTIPLVLQKLEIRRETWLAWLDDWITDGATYFFFK